MNTTQTTSKKTLKDLVHILQDGQEGFLQASEQVADSNLKELFARFSLQRAKFAAELEGELLALGEKDPQNEGTTLAGKLHRGWIDLKAALTKGDAHSVLSEAERGEDVAVKAYKEALEEENLSAPLRSILVSQASQVQLAHDEVKKLRDATKSK